MVQKYETKPMSKLCTLFNAIPKGSPTPKEEIAYMIMAMTKATNSIRFPVKNTPDSSTSWPNNLRLLRESWSSLSVDDREIKRDILDRVLTFDSDGTETCFHIAYGPISLGSPPSAHQVGTAILFNFDQHKNNEADRAKYPPSSA
ncbi:hypothetical protein OC861_006388 [Tilletia horrida]|nr:hypothetical protein OC861_006388 [Tilletia horrida]